MAVFFGMALCFGDTRVGDGGRGDEEKPGSAMAPGGAGPVNVAEGCCFGWPGMDVVALARGVLQGEEVWARGHVASKGCGWSEAMQRLEAGGQTDGIAGMDGSKDARTEGRRQKKEIAASVESWHCLASSVHGIISMR